jgi:prepilin-type processing-associated H-X9-DG protein
MPYIEQGNLYDVLQPGQGNYKSTPAGQPATSRCPNLGETTTVPPTPAGGWDQYLQQGISTYICPSDPSEHVNRKVGGYGKLNYMTPKPIAFVNTSVRIRDISDGTSSSFLLGERCNTEGSPFLHWGGTWAGQRGSNGSYSFDSVPPPNTPMPPGVATATSCCSSGLDRCPGTTINMNTRGGAASVHPGGVHFAMCDGSVHFISENVQAPNPCIVPLTPPYLYQLLHGPSEGGVVGEF